jgi:hypothetical protein
MSKVCMIRVCLLQIWALYQPGRSRRPHCAGPPGWPAELLPGCHLLQQTLLPPPHHHHTINLLPLCPHSS